MEKAQWKSINKKQNGLKLSKNKKSTTLPRIWPKSEARYAERNLEWYLKYIKISAPWKKHERFNYS